MIRIPAPWLETRRIALREFVVVDFPDLYRLDSDPRVMRYLNGGTPLSHAEVRRRFVEILRYYPHHHGLGVWRAARRDSGEFIGWFCLEHGRGTCDLELGYRLLPDAWGKGYATEVTQALLRYAFEDLGVFRVIAVTHPDNTASQRVLLKSGLADGGFARYCDRHIRMFSAERAQPRAQCA